METNFKILIATDYSGQVKNAERYAFQFAAGIRAKLLLLHVCEAPATVSMFMPDVYFPGGREEELVFLNNHGMQIMMGSGMHQDEITYETVVREGDPGVEIGDEARLKSVNFIITGMHGAEGLSKLIPGSHTWDVIKNADCPVLVVPDDGYFTGIRQITYATQYRKEEIPAICFMAKLAECFGAGLMVLHISNFGYSKAMETLMLEKFREELIQELGSGKTDLRLLRETDVVSGLNEFCVRTATDWLVVAREATDLLHQILSPGPNLSKEMSFHTRIPLLVLPDGFQWEGRRSWELLGLVKDKWKEEIPKSVFPNLRSGNRERW